MLKINLLPPELRRKKKRKVVVFEPTQTFLILVVVCELVAFTGVYLMINMRVANKQKELKDLKTEIERLQTEVRDVRKLEEDARALEKKVQIIDHLMLSRVVWSRILSDLSSVIPENIWITSFAISSQSVTPPGGGQPVTKRVLALSGQVLHPPGEKGVNQIGVLMNNMKKHTSFSRTFNDAELIRTATVELEGNRQALSFELQVPFK